MSLNIPLVQRPPHVPVELVRDFDIYAIQPGGPEYQLVLRDALQSADMPDVFWTPHNGGHWVAARGAYVQRVLKDSDHFSSRQLVVIEAMNPDPPFAPLMIDPPEHNKYRALLMPALAPKAVSSLGEKARTLSIELIEGFRAKGECEFIGDFATHLPIAIFMSMVNLPAGDRLYLLEIADTLVRGASLEANLVARAKLAAYITQKIAERRADPGADLISVLTRAEIDGEPLDESTLMGMLTLVMTAGLDTVAAMMGFFAHFLANNPDYRHQLIDDPASIPGAIEEMLRRFPIANLARKVIADCELNGASLKAGEMILAPTVAYGLDERQFENPDTVDFARQNKIHETFGDGAHRCMGSMLARIELQVFLEEWLKRIPDFEVKPGANIQAIGASVAGIHHLPLVWDV
jgi:cytochrome P450